MATTEEPIHYNQGLKNCIRMEVERSDPNNIQNAMKITNRVDALLTNSYGHYGSGEGGSEGITPMKIGNMNMKRFNKLSYAEKKRRVEKKLCFICAKPICWEET